MLSRLTTRFTGGEDRYDLDTTTLKLGLEYNGQELYRRLHDWYSYRKQWVELKTTDSTNFLADINGNDDSIGFYIGQGFSSKW